MAQLTDVGSSTGIMQHLNSTTALYNPVAGTSLLPTFSTGAQMFNLGRPVVNVYSIAAGKLQLASLFTANSSVVVPAYTPTPFTIVDDIVDLQAEYGKDNGIDNNTVESSTAFAANDGRVDSYSNTAPANVTEWKQVLSIRMGVLAKSEFRETPEPKSDPCTSTLAANAPTWAGGTRTFPALGDLTDPTNEARCYRYRVFDTVVPIRNMIWSQG
jgi:type IV pilus assembly protein PilW